MDKKVKIGIGIGVGVLIFAIVLAGILNGWFYKDEPVSNEGDALPSDDGTVIIEADSNYVGAPLQNIINRAGTIKKINKNSVVIAGPGDEELTIYINKDTYIYGADGRNREKEDLVEGMYITADIDGDKVTSETAFDAMIIYISGK